MGNKNGKEQISTEEYLGGRDPVTIKRNEAESLNSDGKILYEAYKAFSKHGISNNEIAKLEKIDDVLKDAAIQLTYSDTRNGKIVSGATIVDNTGKSIHIR